MIENISLYSSQFIERLLARIINPENIYDIRPSFNSGKRLVIKPSIFSAEECKFLALGFYRNVHRMILEALKNRFDSVSFLFEFKFPKQLNTSILFCTICLLGCEIEDKILNCSYCNSNHHFDCYLPNSTDEQFDLIFNSFLCYSCIKQLNLLNDKDFSKEYCDDKFYVQRFFEHFEIKIDESRLISNFITISHLMKLYSKYCEELKLMNSLNQSNHFSKEIRRIFHLDSTLIRETGPYIGKCGYYLVIQNSNNGTEELDSEIDVNFYRVSQFIELYQIKTHKTNLIPSARLFSEYEKFCIRKNYDHYLGQIALCNYIRKTLGAKKGRNTKINRQRGYYLEMVRIDLFFCFPL